MISSMRGFCNLRLASCLLCDFKLQLGNTGDVVLHPEPELCISCSIQAILLKLLAQWLLLVNPLPVLQL